MHDIAIGTSGFAYEDWVGPFYPRKTSPQEYLRLYAERFGLVEIDSTYYRAPTDDTVRNWSVRTPAAFRFALKVPREITHRKVLDGCEAEMDALLEAVQPLGAKLLCLLLQFGYFNRAALAVFGVQGILPHVDTRGITNASENRATLFPATRFEVTVEARPNTFVLIHADCSMRSFELQPNDVFEIMTRVRGAMERPGGRLSIVAELHNWAVASGRNELADVLGTYVDMPEAPRYVPECKQPAQECEGGAGDDDSGLG